jgi:hypothetical protein
MNNFVLTDNTTLSPSKTEGFLPGLFIIRGDEYFAAADEQGWVRMGH